MRTEVINADTIDVAVETLLIELRKNTTSSRENSIYFDGWDGLGASAVLQAIAKRLVVSNETSARPAGLLFEKIIHIDCSKWESRRAMQREIAEQLNLPNWVMDMFDKQDEADDFDGLDQDSRTEIAQVVREIYKTTKNQRFLVVLHNGSSEEIDIFDFGLSLDRYSSSKMLWTFQGRFRLDPKMIDYVKKSRTTDVLLSASRDKRDPHELWTYLVSYEAAQVSHNKHGHAIIDPAIAAQCVLYMLKQSWIGSRIIDYDSAIHTSNYWICDGIIALTDIDKAWRVGDVLQHEMPFLNIDTRLKNDESAVMSSYHLAKSAEHMPYWISTTTSTSGFVVCPSGVIPENGFRHSHMLGVLKLSRCTFSFSSPPFLCCHSLRFLWLEHCRDLVTGRSTTDHHHTEANEQLDNTTTASWECFQSLWVLDVRYTDCDQILSARVMDLMTQLRELNVMGAENWDMSHLQGRLRNIRKLRVTNSTCFFNNNVFSEMESMELLDFSGNHITQGMTSLSGPASLKTAAIDGCDGLKNISFRGCKELANVILKGLLRGLEELDLSGTRVKILNLGEVEYVPKRIILLDSEKLRAILWPRSVREGGRENWPKVVHIDTASPLASAYGGEAPLAHPHADLSLHQQKEEMFKGGWQISFTDTRLLRLLSPVKERFLSMSTLHIDICTASTVGGSDIQETSDKLVQVQQHTSTLMDSKYRDASKDGPVAAMMMWDCPKIYTQSLEYTCIIKMIMHGHGNKTLDDDQAASTTAILFPDFIGWRATTMHVYDNAYITNILQPSRGWWNLTWCRVERCPKLHTFFTVPHNCGFDFVCMKTFWASQLLSVRYIWDMIVRGLFLDLNFLHLDHCPRLIHVLPLHLHCWRDSTRLETLEMVYCGDLREVFPLSPELQEQDKIIEFSWLRRIHLHELPMLQHIETIKVKGCWSLKRLPAVGRDTKPPKVDCEKEWWDKLEWDGLEKYHHPSLYEPSHSLYYKAQLPRGTVLR